MAADAVLSRDEYLVSHTGASAAADAEVGTAAALRVLGHFPMGKRPHHGRIIDFPQGLRPQVSGPVLVQHIEVAGVDAAVGLHHDLGGAGSQQTAGTAES